jgi:hypothetical protein
MNSDNVIPILVISLFVGLSIIFTSLSILTMFSMGRKNYFLTIKSLYDFRVDKVFNSQIKLQFTYSGQSGLKSSTENYYTYVNVKGDKKIILIRAPSMGKNEIFTYMYNMDIISRTTGSWETKSIKISSSVCFIINILKEMVSKKLKKNLKYCVLIDDSKEIDDFLNNQITLVSRDNKINEILQ